MQVRCPYCNNRVEAINRCTVCGRKIEWIKSLYDKSHYYYNKGYFHAKGRELTKAIPYLEKAIYFNKYNIDAKNLLGLIYFEMGEVSLALKSWILSEAITKEDNLASIYIKDLQDHPKQLENYKDSITLYNRALRYMEKKNDDMAVIRLKKAIHLNPCFLEARNLLALCYLYQKQDHKALGQISYILQKDESNEKALHYLREIESKNFIEDQKESAIISTPHINDIEVTTHVKPQKVINRGAIFTRYILYFVFGALCMFGVQIALIVPTKTAQLEQALYDRTTENSNLKVQLDTFTQDAELKIGNLEQSNKKLLSENELLKQAHNKANQENKLWEAEHLKSISNFKACAEVLNNISVDHLKEDRKVVYEELKKSVYPKAGDAFYNEGNQLYKQEKYTDAMIQFEKALIFAAQTKTGANALYNMGQIEEKNNNTNKALQYYNIIIKDYQGTGAYNKAKERIKKLAPEE